MIIIFHLLNIRKVEKTVQKSVDVKKKKRRKKKNKNKREHSEICKEETISGSHDSEAGKCMKSCHWDQYLYIAK